MAKRYLFFLSHAYSYGILRPLQDEIRRRGDEVAWFLEDTCPDMLLPGEKRIMTVREAKKYNPYAVFAPGNWVYDFLPGIKVDLFHGYHINKRLDKDTHFRLRGWYDIYCTQGPDTTTRFKELEAEHKYFKVYETGWSKVDAFFRPSDVPEEKHDRPVIFYSSTFTRGISSAWDLRETIARLAKSRDWDWIITLHPKLDDQELIEGYKKIAEECDNVKFVDVDGIPEAFRRSDVMLSDSSSIIVEYMLHDKPVVTFRNSCPGPWLLDVKEISEVEGALEKALTRPTELMEAMREYTMKHEAHRDGKNCARILDAVDDFAKNYQGKLPRKPLNLIRKIKLRLQAKYYRW